MITTETFTFSATSEKRLVGVDPQLVAVVREALIQSPIDFGVAEGLRDLETQKRYVAEGKSQTLKSKHLIGEAVDLYAYDGKALWDKKSLCKVADAIQKAAKLLGIPITWGGNWLCKDICDYPLGMDCLAEEYLAIKKRKGEKGFVDMPHYQLGLAPVEYR